MTAALPAEASDGVVDLESCGRPPLEPSARSEAERASWLFASALDLVTAGEEVDTVVEAVLGQAGVTGQRSALAGAYGRAVAFRAADPEDRAARQTVEVLAKALSRHHRHRALTPPA